MAKGNMSDRTQDSSTTLLVVDDEPAVRTTLSHVLAEIGYSVRSAEDGVSALAEIQKDIPDIILSDLNMPGMSGFEFLSVVRRRFPSIWVVAMSGAFSGDEVPSGVAADNFYQKGSDIRALLKIIGEQTPPKRLAAIQPVPVASAPQGVQRNENGACGDPASRAPARSACRSSPRLSAGPSISYGRLIASLAGVRSIPQSPSR
jgi:CheY-like chemotaxis protein